MSRGSHHVWFSELAAGTVQRNRVSGCSMFRVRAASKLTIILIFVHQVNQRISHERLRLRFLRGELEKQFPGDCILFGVINDVDLGFEESIHCIELVSQHITAFTGSGASIHLADDQMS